MKKIILFFTAAALSAGMVFVQDIKQATEGLPKGLYIVNGKKCNVR